MTYVAALQGRFAAESTWGLNSTSYRWYKTLKNRETSAMRPEELDDVFAELILRKRAEALLKELSALKRRPQENSIHDTRVQSRRLRAALEVFQDLFPSPLWKTAYDPVRGITRSLGEARETEVSLSLLEHLIAGADLPQLLCSEYLEQRLRRRLRKQQKRLHCSMRRVDLRDLRFRFEHLLSETGRRLDSKGAGGVVIPIRSGGNPKRRLAAGRTRQTFLFPLHGETVERGRQILGELATPVLAFRTRADFRRASDMRLHRLRISTKKLRYAMEVFDEVWPGGLREQIELARLLQEASGNHQDWAVLRRRLLSEIRRLARQEASLLASQLKRILADAESQKAAARKEIPPALTQLQAGLRALLQGSPPARTADLERDQEAQR